MNMIKNLSFNENQSDAQIIEALSQKLVAINKMIAKEFANLEKLQDEIAFVTVKVQGKVDDRREIMRSYSQAILNLAAKADGNDKKIIPWPLLIQ